MNREQFLVLMEIKDLLLLRQLNDDEDYATRRKVWLQDRTTEELRKKFDFLGYKEREDA